MIAENCFQLMLDIKCCVPVFPGCHLHQNGSNVVWLVLPNLVIMSTFARWHFVAIALFLPRFVVGENLAQRAIGHVVNFGTV